MAKELDPGTHLEEKEESIIDIPKLKAHLKGTQWDPKSNTPSFYEESIQTSGAYAVPETSTGVFGSKLEDIKDLYGEDAFNLPTTLDGLGKG